MKKNFLKCILSIAVLFIPVITLSASYDKQRLEQLILDKQLVPIQDLPELLEKLSSVFDSVPEDTFSQFLADMKEDLSTASNLPNSTVLLPTDATLAAPRAHEILYENEKLRILYSSLLPGQIVPFHTHQWSSVILITHGSLFSCSDGSTTYVEEWSPSVEISEGSNEAFQYQNIGIHHFRATIFEFKPS